MRYLITLGLIFFSCLTHAQILINSAGGSLKNEGTEMLFNIGEPLFTQIENDEIILAQGFLQVLRAGGTVSNESIPLDKISFYPNPTQDYLNIEFEKNRGVIHLELLDLGGKLILQEQTDKTSHQLYLNPLSPGVYFLLVLDQENRKQTFKIIKSK